MNFITENDDFIIYEKNVYRYILGTGRIFKSLNVQKLINDISYYKMTVDSGFNKYEDSDGYHHINIPYLVEYQEIEKIKEEEEIELYKKGIYTDFEKRYKANEYIFLEKKLNTHDVQSFYELELEIEVKGFRAKFERSMAYKDKVYVRNPLKEEQLRLQLCEVFGELQKIPELANEKYGGGGLPFFVVDKSSIDKIIGVKRYRDIASFGQEEEKYTGETDEVVLDLHNFDENTYLFFKEHGMLEIENE